MNYTLTNQPDFAPVQVSQGQQQTGKMTILEALAEETNAISPSRSNMSTQQGQADFDDQ